MVSLPDIIRNITEKLETMISVKTDDVEPVSAEGKTIIPVAKVRNGFGAGGGGVGGVEVTAGETRFIASEENVASFGRLLSEPSSLRSYCAGEESETVKSSAGLKAESSTVKLP